MRGPKPIIFRMRISSFPEAAGCLVARSFAFPRVFGWRVAKEVEPGVILNSDPVERSGRLVLARTGWGWFSPRKRSLLRLE
ncbi:UNVERIFIED_CONTAM: hypothetical protein K2H54_049125 [Gekko kuhli]